MTEQYDSQHRIAFVIDGEVVETLHTDSRIAAIVLSNPTIVDISAETLADIKIGDAYDVETATFTRTVSAND